MTILSRLRRRRARVEPDTVPVPVPEHAWITMAYRPYEGALIEFDWSGKLLAGRFAGITEPFGTGWRMNVRHPSRGDIPCRVHGEHIRRWRYL